MTAPALEAAGADLVPVRRLPAPAMAVWRCRDRTRPAQAVLRPRSGHHHQGATLSGRFCPMMHVDEHGDIGGEGCVPVAEPGRRFTVTDRDGGLEDRVVARHADAGIAQRHAGMGFLSGRGPVADQPGAPATTLKD